MRRMPRPRSAQVPPGGGRLLTTAAPSTTTTTAPPAPNLVTNPGFESGLSGWGTGDSRMTLVRTCAAAHSGSCSAELGRKRAGDAMLDDSPNSVSSSTAGGRYSASAWVQAPPGRAVSLRVRELRGTKLLQARTTVSTGTGAWQQLAVTSDPVAGGTSVSVDVVVSLPTTLRARVDDVALRRT